MGFTRSHAPTEELYTEKSVGKAFRPDSSSWNQMLSSSAETVLWANPQGSGQKAPPAAVLKEKAYVSTIYIKYTQNVYVSSINAGMAASLFYTP